MAGRIVATNVLACFNVAGCASSTAFALVMPFALLTVFWTEFRLWHQKFQQSCSVSNYSTLHAMRQDLKEHQVEKKDFVLSQFLPTSLASLAVLLVPLFKKESVTGMFSLVGGPHSLALYASTMAAIVILDSCLDECEPASLPATKVASFSFMIPFVKLASCHFFFTILATEVLLKCILAGTPYKPWWNGLVALYVGTMGTSAAKGLLPSPPLGLAPVPFFSFVFFSFLCGTAYEKIQNTPNGATRVKLLKKTRLLCNIAFAMSGVPPLCIIYDPIRFFHTKLVQVIQDTGSLEILKEKV